MNHEQLINSFTEVRECDYKGRHYLVRDNGAVCRKSKEDGKRNKWDEEWTFGKQDPKTNYMLIGQERVHRIVCWAYHGEPIGDRNVADHIDTNRCNNSPKNLRWVTKLENTLNNPITRAKIELICGSVEAFLNNPKLLYGHESENPNFTWMRAVTKEEAERSLKRWNEWAAKPVEERKAKGERKGPGEWLFSDEERKNGKEWMGESLSGVKSWAQQKEEIEMMNQQIWEEEHGLKDSLTSGAKQLNWKTPTEFPGTPKEISSSPLKDYLSYLCKGVVYCRNQYGDSIVYDAAISEDGSHLSVLTEITGATNYALSEVTFEEGAFIHDSIRMFFTEEGANKYYMESLGREWTGGDVLEDYC